jgi:hypothetical protein
MNKCVCQSIVRPMLAPFSPYFKVLLFIVFEFWLFDRLRILCKKNLAGTSGFSFHLVAFSDTKKKGLSSNRYSAFFLRQTCGTNGKSNGYFPSFFTSVLAEKIGFFSFPPAIR